MALVKAVASKGLHLFPQSVGLFGRKRRPAGAER